MKIDLTELEADVRAWVFHHDETLALIRVARAAKAFIHCYEWPRKSELRMELAAALSDIEDSKQ